MTKKRAKMSFHARRVEIVEETRIMGIVDNSTKPNGGNVNDIRESKIVILSSVLCTYVFRYSDDRLFRYGGRTLEEHTDGKQHRGDAGECRECRRGGNKLY
jgi:hypothetical protein